MRWLVIILVAACGGSHQDPAPPAPVAPDATPALAFEEEDARQLADGFLEVLGAMADAVEARVRECDIPKSGPCAVDCSALAGDLDAIFDVSAPLFEVAAKVQRDDAAARLAVAAMKAHADAAAELEARISHGLGWCRENTDLIEVINRMPML